MFHEQLHWQTTARDRALGGDNHGVECKDSRTQNRELGESPGSEFWGAPTFRKEKEKGANEVCSDAFQ